MAKMLVWNKESKYEMPLTHESQLWPLLNFAFGMSVRLGPTSLLKDGCERREIIVDNKLWLPGITMGHVTWLD